MYNYSYVYVFIHTNMYILLIYIYIPVVLEHAVGSFHPIEEHGPTGDITWSSFPLIYACVCFFKARQRRAIKRKSDHTHVLSQRTHGQHQ